MRNTVNSRIVLKLPYLLTRQPLSLLDSAVASRLREDSSPRMMFNRAVGSYDQFAGRLLNDETITQQGNDRVARADKLASAVVLEREAAERREAAAATARSGREKAAAKAEQARDRMVGGREDAEATEREEKQAAAERARAAAARRKQQAEEHAEEQVQQIDNRVERVENMADARVKKATKTANRKLSAAKDERDSASAARADADQLGTLAASKRQTRKQS
jgi:hypothetical protein